MRIGVDIATAGVVGRNLDSKSVNGSKVTDGSLTGFTGSAGLGRLLSRMRTFFRPSPCWLTSLRSASHSMFISAF